MLSLISLIKSNSSTFGLMVIQLQIYSQYIKWSFSLNEFFSKCNQIGRKMRSWSHLLKKSLNENFTFYAVPTIKTLAIPIATSDIIMWCVLTYTKRWKCIKLYHQTVRKIFFSLPKQSRGQYKVQQQQQRTRLLV